MSSNLVPPSPQGPTDLAPSIARKFGLPMAPEVQAAYDAYDERNLRASWGAALETDPGMRAEAEQHARSLGQPVETVAENMDIARKMVKERQLQYQQLRDRYPALLDRFSDVKFAAVAHDDVGNLKLTEGAFDWVKRSWNAGRAQNEYGWIGTRRALRMDTAEDRLRAAVIERRGLLDGGDGWASTIVQTASQMAGTVVNSLAAGAAAGTAATLAGPAAPVASPVAFTWASGSAFIAQAMAVEGGSHYNELRRQGFAHETAQTSALGVGLLNGALEAVGAKIAAAPFKAAYRNVFLKNAEKAIANGLIDRTASQAAASFGREYLKVLASETSTEVMQEFVTMAGERIAREKERPDQSPMTWAEVGSRIGDVFVQTVQAMSVLGLPGPGAQFITDSMRANHALKGKELLEKLAKGANASELAKRSPERFRQFVAKAAEGTDATEMFIEPEQLRAVLEQTGVTEEQFGALVPDVVAQLEQADADGSPVSIPTEVFAATLAKTDVGKAMMPHIKFTPTGFTVAQGEKFQTDAPKMAEQAAAEFEKQQADTQAVRESVREVEATLRTQLLATGKFDKQSANAAASYYGAFVSLQAARAKMMPAEFAAKYPLRVGLGEAPQQGVVRQDGMAKTDSPEFKAWFGDSKVVDESGAPLVVYHGSKAPNEDFAFDFSKIGSNGRAEGAGFYFTTDEKVASGYAGGGTMLRSWLSIKKPMPLDRKGFTKAQLKKILMRAAEMEAAGDGTDIRDGFLANYGDTYTSVAGAASEAANLIASDDRAVDQMGGMVGGGLSPEYVNRAVVEVTGFDGIVSNGFGGEGKGGGTIYVAFLPEQIKSVNNRGTFDPADPNILRQTTKGTFDPASFAITLTADADSSTVLHEFGHAFLTMMADLAIQPDAPIETVRDVQTIMDWFGVKDAAAWNAMTLAEQTPHHEAFARSFETYLFDGKAPSTAMEGVFRRFSRWVRAAYKQIRDGINAAYRAEFGRDLPGLTPEVRGVFDRMVASEEAISQAEALRSMQPMFTTEEEFAKANPDAGPNGWAGYQAAVAEAHEMAVEDHTRASLRQMKWLTGARGRILKAMQREGKATRAKVEAKEMRKASEEKVYAAMERIRYGEMDDNGERTIPLKLNLTEFRQNPLGDETREKRFGTGKNGLLAANGLPLDTVAQVVGYGSGEELIRAMVASRPIEEVVAERTDARMLEEHGNLVPGSDEMEDDVTEALHNEARARFVAIEWAHLAKAGQPLNQVRRQLRASAERQLAAMATGRISPHQFALAEANAARESMRASKAGKFDDALLWKRKQLMQGELAKQAVKVRAEIEKAREEWKRFAAADTKVAETRNIDLVNAGRVLGYAYGLAGAPETAQQAEIRRQAIVDTLRTHQVIGGQLQGLLTDGVGQWKDVPLSRFRDVAEMGRALWDLARRVNEVEADGRKVALQEASAELRAQVATLPDRAKSAKAPGGETVSGPSRWMLKGWNALASLKRMEHWARFMDGGKDGPFTRYMVKPVMAALARYRDAKAGIIAEMHPRLVALAKSSGKAWDAKIAAPELNGFTFQGIKEVVGAMLHTGSESNRFKLLGDKVRQWCPVYDDPETGTKTVNPKNWDDFIARMQAEGRITKEHWDYVRFVWGTYAKVLPEAQKTHKALMGREFETIELRDVETAFGNIPGGYVPATTDRDEVSAPRPAESIEGIAGMEQNFEWSVSTGKGFTIERNPNYAQPLVLNVARQLVGIDAELRFIHLQPTIRDVLRVSRERQFAEALAAYDRDAVNAIITPWLENTATQASSRPSDIPLVDKLATLLRRGTSLAALGLNFFNAVIQVTGISNARGEVKGRYMRSALGLWLRNPRNAVATASDWSTAFRQRMDARTKVMAQDIARIGDPGLVPGLKATQDKLGNAAFFPQRLMQGIADTVTWHGAYAQAMAEGKPNVLLTSDAMHEWAVEQADSVLRRVQGSQNPEDLAAYEAGTPLAKLFTQFGSYSNTVLNQFLGAGKGNRAKVALWAILMPALIESSLRILFAGKVDKDDDDKYLDDLAVLYGRGLLRNAIGLIPGAGPLALSLAESEGSRMAATPAGTSLQSAVQGMFAIRDLAIGEDLSSYQIRNLGTMLTILSGLPLAPLARAAGYAQDVDSGKIVPTGPGDMVRGLVTGQR